LRLALWSARTDAPERSWITALRPHFPREIEVIRVEEAPVVPPAADLDLYEIADDPAHAFAYHAALARPGVVLLRDWSLHRLVAHATLGSGDPGAYLHEMRRAHGETGTFVARQVARGLGGRLLPSLFAVNDRLLEQSLGVIAPTTYVGSRAARRLPGRPILELPLDLLLPPIDVPGRDAARRVFGLPEEAPVVVVCAEDPEAARLAVALRALGRLGRSRPGLRVVTLATGPLSAVRLVEWLAAADVVVALRFPACGVRPEVVVRALEAGRPVLVTAGTPAAGELPEGVVIHVDPDIAEEAELEALLAHLLDHSDLRSRIGAVAREHLEAARQPEAAAACLLGFLRTVAAGKEEALRAIAADRADERTLLGYAMEEVRGGARDLGLVGRLLGLGPLLADLLGRGDDRRNAKPDVQPRSPPPPWGGTGWGVDE